MGHRKYLGEICQKHCVHRIHLRELVDVHGIVVGQDTPWQVRVPIEARWRGALPMRVLEVHALGSYLAHRRWLATAQPGCDPATT
eukprot:SAG31_NODE_15359_length_759_cov_0.772727_1_plen_85_part_00